MKLIQIILSIVIASYGLASAQNHPQNFSTMTGQMVITGKVGDSSIMMKNDQLVVTLNYETAELLIHINEEFVPGSSSAETGINPPTEHLLFKGELGIDHVITRKHPPMDFKVSGFFYHEGGKKLIEGKGRLEHIYSDQYACILNLNFKVPPSVLSLDWHGEEPVEIQIIQTILK